MTLRKTILIAPGIEGGDVVTVRVYTDYNLTEGNPGYFIPPLNIMVLPVTRYDEFNTLKDQKAQGDFVTRLPKMEAPKLS